MSVLADALKTLNNAEKSGKRQVLIRPCSKVIVKYLQVMQKHGENAKILPQTGCS
jgi:small subunit ribosomal protein S15Ae